MFQVVVLGACGPVWEVGNEAKASEYSLWPLPWNNGAWCKYCEPSLSVQIVPLLLPWIGSV